MKTTKTQKPAKQWQTLWMAIAGIGLGLWCVFSHEFDDASKYYIPSKISERGDIRDGKDINRQRQIGGVLFLLVGVYCSFCLVRRKQPFFAASDFEPEIIHRVTPEMPVFLNDRSIGGQATVEFVISIAGDVTDAKVYLATHPEFGEAALKAIRLWKFSPAIRGNVPTTCLVRQSFDFNPDGLINISQRGFRSKVS